jgi:hypothetical protein
MAGGKWVRGRLGLETMLCYEISKRSELSYIMANSIEDGKCERENGLKREMEIEERGVNSAIATWMA